MYLIRAPPLPQIYINIYNNKKQQKKTRFCVCVAVYLSTVLSHSRLAISCTSYREILSITVTSPTLLPKANPTCHKSDM